MCIRDSACAANRLACSTSFASNERGRAMAGSSLEQQLRACLLYTSDAADERSSVDLGGRRIIKKKKNKNTTRLRTLEETR